MLLQIISTAARHDCSQKSECTGGPQQTAQFHVGFYSMTRMDAVVFTQMLKEGGGAEARPGSTHACLSPG